MEKRRRQLESCMTATNKAPWLDAAKSLLGTREGPGKANNKVVLGFYADAGHPEISMDATPWCAAFCCAMLKRNGYPIPMTDALMARSFRRYGIACEPKVGAIAVFPRGKPPSGHVGFVAKVNANGTVDLLGGNQGDAVSIAKGTYKIKDALAFRWPVAPTKKELKDAGSTEIKESDLLKNVATIAPSVGVVGTVTEKIANTPAVAAPPPAPVTDAGLLDQVKNLAEPIGIVQTVTEGTVAMGNLLMANLWLLGVIGLSVLVWYIAHQREKARIAKHKAGVPLSKEVTE
jgi:uncharacterized protein (TIGR02594 family)